MRFCSKKQLWQLASEKKLRCLIIAMKITKMVIRSNGLKVRSINTNYKLYS